MWQVLKEMGVPDHFIRLLRNLYVDQEATVRTEHGITEWFKIGKGVRQGCILSPYLFNLYAEYIMRKAWLDESKAGINIARRNINNLRYADETTLMDKSQEELEDLLMRRKLLRIPWIARRSNKSVLHEIKKHCSRKAMIMRLKLKYFGHIMRRQDSLAKTLMLGKIEGTRRRGRQRRRWIDEVTEATNMKLYELRGTVTDRCT
ncbi:Hypothetical predicted protein [Pelobates cultripes]|uniref:Reverse transcriptase domain-containing protein n=1 Tax=Pelobates cultripes TaxID=61616 RepID=A0AAD1RZ04_PELCU|nr:Hypothetical predicted protein [Pelobates cultripes]